MRVGHQTNKLILTAFFAALTAVGGWIRLPFFPVPLTLQTFVVFLAGAVLGSRYGALSQFLYLGVGLMGMPIFSQGGGPGYVLQPSFGYLAAFPLGAWIVGKKGEDQLEGQTLFQLVLRFFQGGIAIYLLGVAYLWVCLKYIIQQPVSVFHAVWIGALVFLPGEAVKSVLAATLYRRLSPILKKWGM